MRPSRALLFVASLSFLTTACAKPSPAQPVQSSNRAAAREITNADDSVAVSGLRGTLTQEEIRGALEPKLPKFLRCASARLSELEALSGSLTFSFHIALNGSVAAVQPSQSSLGDRATERCMLEVARATRFPAPHGGEADFTWPLELPLDSEVRAPVELGADFAQPVLAKSDGGTAQGAALQGGCGGPQYLITAYVDPEGRVLGAGAATPDSVTDSQLDCIASGVASWTFPSPGSYLGKVSFTVP